MKKAAESLGIIASVQIEDFFEEKEEVEILSLDELNK